MTTLRHRALAWPPAFMVSIGLHILAALVLVKTTIPDPIAFSDAVRSRFAVSTVSVPSQRAEEARADVATTAATTAAGDRLAVQSIPRGRAEAVDPQTTAATAVRPAGTTLSPTAAPLATAAAAVATQRVAATNAPTERLPGVATDLAPIAGARVDSANVVATTAEATLVGAHQPDSVRLTGAARETSFLPAALPQISGIEPTAPTARLQAAVAAQSDRIAATGAADDVPTARLAVAQPGAEAVASREPAGDIIAAQVAAATALGAAEPESIVTTSTGGDGETLGAVAPSGATVTAAAGPAQIAATLAAQGTVVVSRDAESTQIASADIPIDALGSERPQSATLTEAAANGEAVAPSEADGTELGVVEAAGPVVSELAAPAIEIGSTTPTHQVAKAVPDAGTSVETDAPETARIDAAVPDAAAVTSNAPQGVGIDPAPPTAASVDSVLPAGRIADATDPVTVAAEVSPQNVADAAAKTEARQAWAGNVNTGLDEQSLAAIQSFMQPAHAAEAQVREGIGAALARFPCSRLQAAFLPETGGLEVRGHIPIAELRGLVVGLLEQSVGTSIPVGGSLMVLPPPQCGVLEAIEGLGLPQSDEQQNDPLVVGKEAQADILQFEDGMRMTFRLKAAEYASFIYVDFYDRDGVVQHILPNERSGQIRRQPNQRFEVGRGGDEDVELFAAAPFGQDIAVVLAATRPLYEGLRPPAEPATAYLAWLQARIRALRKEDPAFRGEWAYLFVTTGARGSFAQP